MPHKMHTAAPGQRSMIVLAAVGMVVFAGSSPWARASGRALHHFSKWGSQNASAPLTPSPTIERIDVRGNISIRDKVIRRALLFAVGDRFDARRLVAANRQLMGLGYFSNVTITTTRGSARNRIVIRLQVAERPMGQFFIYVGVGRSLVAAPLPPSRSPPRASTRRRPAAPPP